MLSTLARQASGSRPLICIALAGMFSGLASAQAIANATELAAMSSNLSGDYYLTADIDLTGVIWTPVGDQATPFTGSFDGSGFTISNLDLLDLNGNAGLFGVASDASFHAVRMSDCQVVSTTNTGTLVGLDLGSEFTKCRLTDCNVLGINSAGGMVGRTVGSGIYSATARTFVTATQFGGGLVGHAHIGTLLYGCRVSGTATGSHIIGGLSGNLHASWADRCSTNVTVTCTGAGGGITGWLQEDHLSESPAGSIMTECTAYGDVHGSSGGLVTLTDPLGNMLIVTGSIGGLAGHVDQYSYIDDGVAYGDMVCQVSASAPFAGGICGFMHNDCLVRNCRADGDVLGGQTSGGIASWAGDNTRFEDCMARGNVAGFWQTGGLVGALERADIIRCHARGDVTAVGLLNGHSDPGRLAAAVGGLVGYTFPSSTEEFACFIYQSSATGNVTSQGQFTGGLIGLAWGVQAIECYATGTVVSNERRIGGLVGGSVSSTGTGTSVIPRSEFASCYSWGKVVQLNPDPGFDGMVGGLIGELQTSPSCQSHLHRCYSSGYVEGSGTVGGLVGEVGLANLLYHNSYWDTDSSDQPTSAVGEGRTQAQMFQQATYVGWNFTGIWEIEENVGYPTLQWQ